MIDYETMNAAIVAIGETDKERMQSMVALLWNEKYDPKIKSYWVFYWPCTPSITRSKWGCVQRREDVPATANVVVKMERTGRSYHANGINSQWKGQVYLEFAHGYRGLRWELSNFRED